MCLDAHQHFWESEVTFGMYVSSVLYPLTGHHKKAQFVPPPPPRPPRPKKKKEIYFEEEFALLFFFSYCSHPDCSKLPHTDKQSENVEFKSELTKPLAFRWI